MGEADNITTQDVELNGAMFSDVNNVQQYSTINERCKTRSSFNLNKEF